MDRPDPPFPPFDWAGAQQRFLDAVAAFGVSPDGSGPLNPWQKAMDFWWRGAQAAVPDRDRALYDNLIGRSRAFYGVAEQFSRLLAAMSSAPGAGDWEAALREQMEAWKSRAAADDDPALGGLLQAWQAPADAWQKMVALLAPPAAAPGAAVPGPLREFQRNAAEGAHLWEEYQRALHDYREALSGIAVDAVNRLHIRILAVGAEGRSLTTLREIFDLWIECCEAAYAERVFTEDYSRRFGKLVNSLTAFRRHGQEWFDTALAAANLPTRHGIDSMQRAQREMRREVQAAAAQGAANAEALDHIRRELEALREQLQDAPRAAGRRRRRGDPSTGGGEGAQ